MASTARIVVCDGDQTGQELLVQSLRVMRSDLLGVDLELEHFDLSLPNRVATNNNVVRGKLDQKSSHFEVDFAMGRDIRKVSRRYFRRC